MKTETKTIEIHNLTIDKLREVLNALGVTDAVLWLNDENYELLNDQISVSQRVCDKSYEAGDIVIPGSVKILIKGQAPGKWHGKY